ncbi:MAG: FKBP-type peptidyl-prolyl cis-trans isomerase [Chitinophagaceae bacterium]|nr:FKBP-type peptidyl-prolyl cis-trans isomerase [Chitinophagaceae bacterium]
MKKNSLLFFTAVIVLAAGCAKSSSSSCTQLDVNMTAPQNEITALMDSLVKYNITDALQHPSGVFYRIIDPGTGGIVSNLCTKVTSTYWGGFFDGRKFDESTRAVTFTLGQTILGWHKAIPLVKEGGEIEIYIPPSLGYGDEDIEGPDGTVVIPKNSYLVFKVQVIKFS